MINNEDQMYFLPTAISGNQMTSKEDENLLPQFGSDNSPQNASGYQRNNKNNISQYQNLYTTSPAMTTQLSNMPRMYSNPSMPRFDKSLDFSNVEKKPIMQLLSHPLIDWINSFNDPYCLLVNSFSDLIDGIALCHLVGIIVCSPSDQEKIKQLVYYEAVSKDLSLQNLDLAINVLKSSNMPVPQDVQKIQASDLTSTQDSTNMQRVVEVLRQIYEIVTFNSKQKSQTRTDVPTQETQANVKEQALVGTQQIKGINQGQSAMLITPREKSISSGSGMQVNSHQQPMIISQSTSRGGIRGYGSSTERQMDSAGFHHQHLLSYQSDVKSAKENIAPNPPPFNVMPFPNPSQLQILQQQTMSYPINTYPLDHYPERNFDKSFETNNISPIIPQTRKISPGPQSSKSQISIPRVNIQAAIQQSQEDLHEIEELQLVQELNDLNLSYQKQKQTNNLTPSNNVSRLQHRQQSGSKNSSQSKSARSKQMFTNSQEQKERLRQKQQDLNDYGKVLKSTQNVMMRSKITDSDVNFNMKDFQKPQLEAPPSFIQESQINHGEVTGGQKSIRFKEVQDSQQSRNTHRMRQNEDDDIMSEMQTLNVKPEVIEGGNKDQQRQLMFSHVKIEQVDIRVKQRVLEWLGNEIKLLKANSRLLDDFPLYCKNGVFLCDLANRLSSRSDTIKGVHRNPKNVTHILNNFNRVLDHFRSFPRFCPRYLWAHRYLMDGHPDVVWGLLDDIWHWSMNKISPYDPTHEKNLYPLPADSKSPTTGVMSPKSQSQDQKHKFIPSKPKLPPRAQLPLQFSKADQVRHENNHNASANFNIKRPNSSGTPIKENFQSLEREKSYSNLHQKTPQKSQICASDLPLQIQNSQHKIKQNPSSSQLLSNNGALNSSRSLKHLRNNSGKSKRVDVSAFGSPIAKDQAGNLYFMKSGEEIYNCQFQGDERNANSLFSTKKQPPSNHLNIEINDEIEGEIRKWLFDLKFGHYLSKEFEYRDICNDPFSNGLLFAELFSYLEKMTLLKIISSPRTIGESRENLNKVLSIIKQRKREFPLKLLNDQSIELVLKRDKQIIYQILYHLKILYPDSGKQNANSQPNYLLNLQTPTNNNSQTQQNLILPYTIGEMKLLEISLINWLTKLGLFSKIYGTLEIESFIQIQREITNGILLSDLISTLFNVKLPGIFKEPKVEATCISNIRKPLEILRRQSRMSQKFTWTEREIYEGQMNVIIGLLEDLHRCFDGLPPRKRGLNYFADGPYLGDTLYNQIQKEDKPKPIVKVEQKENVRQSFALNKMQETLQTVKTAPETLKIEVLTQQDNQYQEIPSIFMQNKAVTSVSPRSNSKSRQDTTKINEGVRQPNFSQFLNMKLQKEFRQNFSPINQKPFVGRLEFLKPSITLDDKQERSIKKHNFNLPQQQQDILSSQKKDMFSQYPVPPTRSPLNINNRCQSFEFEVVRSNIKKPPHQISIAEYENEEHTLNRYAYQLQEKKKISEWIRSLQINLPLGFNLEVEPVIFFKDGILLCELIASLEGLKIDNIQLNPKSQASCLQNLRKALQVLKKKNVRIQLINQSIFEQQVPLYLLYSEEEIYNGNAEIIIELLKCLRSSYRHKGVRISTNSLSTSQGRNRVLAWTAGASQE